MDIRQQQHLERLGVSESVAFTSGRIEFREDGNVIDSRTGALLGHVASLRPDHATEGELLRLWRSWNPTKVVTPPLIRQGLKPKGWPATKKRAAARPKK